MTRARYPHLILLAASLAALTLLAGCSEDDSTGPGDDGGPASAEIGPAGGSLTSGDGDLTLTVPAGALAAATTLTLETLEGDDVPAELAAEGVTLAYALGPEGTTFQQPVSLAFEEAAPALKMNRDFELQRLIMLVTLVATVPRLLDAQVMTWLVGDGRLRVETHITEAGIVGMLRTRGIGAGLQGVPDEAACGTTYPVTAYAGREATSPFRGTVAYVDRSQTAYTMNPLSYTGSNFTLGLVTDEVDTVTGVADGYVCACDDATSGSLVADLHFDQYRVSPVLFSSGRYTITFDIAVPCTPSGSGGGQSQVGVTATQVSLPEGLSLARPFFAGIVLTTLLLLVAGGNGWGLVQQTTGVMLMALFLVAGFARYGVLSLSHPSAEKQGGYVDAAFSFGPSGTGLTHYFPDDGEWGWTQLGSFQSNVTDAVTFGNSPVSSGLVSVNNSLGVINFVEFDAEQDLYVGTSEVINSFAFPDLSGGLVSAYAPTADGPILAVSDGSPGKVYVHPRGGETTATLVGETGDGPRRVRHAGGIAAVSNFLSGTLTILTWDGGTTAAIAGTATVGDGPIGIDLLDLGDGTVAICSTGFNDDTYTVTVVDAAGAVVSNVTSAAPGGCTGPGHAIWARDGTRNLIFTCNGSDEIATVASGL